MPLLEVLTAAIGPDVIPRPSGDWSALLPAPFTYGNSSRTIPNVMSDGVRNVDFSLFKDFRVTERTKLQFRAEAFNLTNTAVFDTPGVDVQSRTFGVVTATAFSPKPRELQLALKLTF